jgi:hypothetical protein
VIREAVSDDLPSLINHCKDHHREKQFAFPFDPVLVSITISNAIISPDWLVLVGERSALIAFSFDDVFGSGRLAFERLLRADGDLDELLDRFEAWAADCRCVTASLSSLERHEAFARLYRRRGYLLSESVFTKVL